MTEYEFPGVEEHVEKATLRVLTGFWFGIAIVSVTFTASLNFFLA
jgi:hypothetical protein